MSRPPSRLVPDRQGSGASPGGQRTEYEVVDKRNVQCVMAFRLSLGTPGRGLFYAAHVVLEAGWPREMLPHWERWALASLEQEIRGQVLKETGLELPDLTPYLQREPGTPGSAQVWAGYRADGTLAATLRQFEAGYLPSGRPAPALQEDQARALLARARARLSR